MRFCPECGRDTRRRKCEYCEVPTWPEGSIRPTDPDAPHTLLKVVGESHYQPALKAMRRRDGDITAVVLHREPDNPFDRNAVRVCDHVTGETVGYLKKHTAKQFGEAVTALAGKTCPAELTGGSRRARTIGIFFDAAALHALRAELNPKVKARKPQQRRSERSSAPTVVDGPVPAAHDRSTAGGCLSVVLLWFLVIGVFALLGSR